MWTPSKPFQNKIQTLPEHYVNNIWTGSTPYQNDILSLSDINLLPIWIVSFPSLPHSEPNLNPI